METVCTISKVIFFCSPITEYSQLLWMLILEILEVHSRYPNTFYPLFRLQVHIMKFTLGVTRWEFHKAMLHDTILEEKAIERRKQFNKIKQEVTNPKRKWLEMRLW